MEPYEYEDEAGDKLTVSEADGGVFVDASRVFVPSMEMVDLCVAMFARSGQPVPVITPRPDVDTRAGMDFGPLRLKVAERGRVTVQAGAVTETWPSSRVRQVAGAMAAYADAAESEPDPAEVTALAAVLASPEAMGLAAYRDMARRAIAAGWKREAPDA